MKENKSPMLPGPVRLVIRMYLWHIKHDLERGLRSAAEMAAADRKSVYAARQHDYYRHAVSAVEWALQQVDGPSPILAVLRSAAEGEHLTPEDRAEVLAALAIVEGGSP